VLRPVAAHDSVLLLLLCAEVRTMVAPVQQSEPPAASGMHSHGQQFRVARRAAGEKLGEEAVEIIVQAR
jgi:hypothetical protein